MSKTKKKQNVKKEEMVLNIDTLGVPIAIILSAVLIAALIFFSSRGGSTVKNTPGSGDTNQETQTPSTTGSDVVVNYENEPYLGDGSKAKVAIVEFSDYMCGYCQRHSQETFPKIKENYIDTGKIIYVFKEFPLSAAGQMGFTIAEGGVCLFDLAGNEEFAEYHKKAFFAESKDVLISLAGELGVDTDEFGRCLEDGRFRDAVNANATDGRKIGITGTPGFVVGLIGDDGNVTGTIIAGAFPYETFADAIDKLLK
jgi:protein-disulfide isomerase